MPDPAKQDKSDEVTAPPIVGETPFTCLTNDLR